MESKLRYITSNDPTAHLRSNEAYLKLRETVFATTILDRAYLFYGLMIVLSLGAFFACLYFLYTSTSYALLALWSVLMVISAVQVGGLMHDAGHRSMFKSVFFNDFWGNIFATVMGMPFGDWRTTHNKHHAHPNQDEEDPDIELPLISLTVERYRNRKGLSKLIAPYQAYLWYPLGSLVSFSKRLYGYKYFRRNWSLWLFPEVVLYILGIYLWFGLPFTLLPLSQALVVFFTTNLLLGVYLANIFAPNHKGMPQIAKGVKLGFLQQQVMTSRNIYPHPVTDLAYIGLNYQIEHHLFPNCPRNKLKLLTPYVKEICDDMGIEFTEVGVLESNRLVLSELREVSLTA